MARQVKYSFLKKNVAAQAKLSILLALISLAVMPVLLLLSFFGVGRGRLILGAVALVAVLLAIYAFVLGIRALTKRDSRIRTAAAATILSGVVLIAWISVFVFGTV